MKKSLSQSSYIVHKKTLFCSSNNIVCALSGGQDSILLFLILIHLRVTFNIKLQVIFCNHFWQIQNFYTVFEIWKLMVIFQIPVNFFFAEQPLLNEEKARIWRQKNFSRSSEFFQSQHLILGHTGTDIIETALWNLVRGTSPKGLISLQPQRKLKSTDFTRNCIIKYEPFIKQKTVTFINKKNQNFSWNLPINRCHNKVFHSAFQKSKESYFLFIKYLQFCLYQKYIKNTRKKIRFFCVILKPKMFFGLIRPLYNFHRSDIGFIVKENQLPRITDSTNLNKKLTRNRLRSDLLPILRFFINKNTDFHLFSYLELSRIEQEFLENIIQTLLESYLYSPKTVKLISLLPKAIQSACIYQLTKNYTLRQLDALQIQYILSQIL